MTLALIALAVVTCFLVPRYVRACADNAEIANAHRERMYAAAATLLNAPDDVVPTEILRKVRGVVVTSRSKFFLPRITLHFLTRKIRGGGRIGGGNLSRDLALLAPPLQKQLHAVLHEGLSALAHNDVIFGAIIRWAIKRARTETRAEAFDEAVVEFEKQAYAA